MTLSQGVLKLLRRSEWRSLEDLKALTPPGKVYHRESIARLHFESGQESPARFEEIKVKKTMLGTTTSDTVTTYTKYAGSPRGTGLNLSSQLE